eukprot:285838_1
MSISLNKIQSLIDQIDTHTAMSEEKTQESARKILVIGGNGCVGSAVVKGLKQFSKEFNKNLEIIVGGRSKDKVDVTVDISSSESITNMFENDKCKNLNDVICCAGMGLYGAFDDNKVNRDKMVTAFNSKVIGQIDLVMKSQKYLNDKDNTVTLISGYTAKHGVPGFWGASAQNAALNAFVKCTPIEIKNTIRVNVICPGLLTEAKEKYASYFLGFKTIDGSDVANAFIRAIFGGIRGKALYVDNPNNAQEM